MLKKIQNRKQSGFTIIEVLIVLAIAGLILLIVFLAVPSLERSQRNTGRKEDAGRLVTAIGDYVSNNNGALPVFSSATWIGANGACATILNDAGSLNQGSWTSSNCLFQSPATAGAFDLESGGISITTTNYPNTSGFNAILDEGATCTDSTDSATSSNDRQSVLFYDLEVGSGDENWSCINVS